MKFWKYRAAAIGAIAAAAVPGSAFAADADTPVPPAALRDTMSDTWAATDALGRIVPVSGSGIRAPHADRTVGIFYFLWQNRLHDGPGLFDVSKILAKNPADPPWGPVNAFHWWSEPELGYYLDTDPFVLRRHMQMLADAGVDVLICDITNALTYPDSCTALCEVCEQIRREGGRTPQIAFITHSAAGKTAQKIYDELYGKNRYPDLWFRWKGKPLLLAKPEDLTPEMRNFFTVRESWAWSNPGGWFGDGHDKWPWLDNTPQRPGWHESPDKPEEIVVSAAGHPTTGIGRSMHDGKEPPEAEQHPEQGLYLAEQWKRALEVDPEFVFVTGWNEWIAMRFVTPPNGSGQLAGKPLKPGDSFFVDEFSPEFSRDIEPMKGGFGDNYYYQLVAAVRRYKGVRPLPLSSPPKTISIGGPFAQWTNVGPEYRDDIGDTAHRDHIGFGGAGPYINDTGRNDLETMKVSRDRVNLYFYVRTAAPITAPDTASNWMTLLLSTRADGDRTAGWESYDYAVRRVLWKGRETTALCRNVGGGWKWEPVLPLPVRIAGREMQISIPRAALGIPAGRPLRIDFKWADNVPDSGDIRDFEDGGDVAPNGRFRYRYQEKPDGS